MDLGLEGRVAVVAASSKGLGRAAAEALAGEGARLVISGRGQEALVERRGRRSARRAPTSSPSRPTSPIRTTPDRLVAVGDRAVRPPRHRRSERRRSAPGEVPRSRRRGHPGRDPGEPAQQRPVRSGGVAPSDGGEVGADLFHQLVHHHPGKSDARPLQHGAGGALGLGEDRGRRSSGDRRDTEPRLSRLARHRPHARARRRQRDSDGRSGRLRQGRGVLVLRAGGERERGEDRRRRRRHDGALTSLDGHPIGKPRTDSLR